MQNPLEKPIELEPFVGLYTMFFRHPSLGNYLMSKNFRLNGSLKEARERAELYCNIIGGKLNYVQPLISNLQLEENYKLNGGLVKENATS